MKNIGLFRFWLSVALSSLLCAGSIPSWAAGSAGELQALARVQNESQLLKLMERQDRVRAIVRIRFPRTGARAFVPEALLSLGSQRTEQRQVIATIRQQLLGQLAAYKVRAVRKFDSIPFLAVEVDRAGFDALRASPLVESIQEDRRFSPALAQSIPLIGADIAWAQGYSGAGQVVAILDTGVDALHPFLAGKVVAEACFSSTTADSSSLCPSGQDEEIGPGAAAPCASGCAHGTHVAGIAAGNGENLIPSHQSGVAKDATIAAANIFSYFPTCDGGGAPAQGVSKDEAIPAASGCVLAWESDIIAGLLWVYDLANDPNSSLDIAAVNMSLGGSTVSTVAACDSIGDLIVPGPDVGMKAAIDNLRSLDIATVIASGNSGSSTGISYPGCISSAISVGSTTDVSDSVSSFSNSASWLSLLAPGESIDSSVPGAGYASLRGTSMATPHVVGAWAVIKSSGRSNTTVDGVLGALRLTGTKILDGRNGFEKARIQLDALLDSFLPGDPLPFDRIIDDRSTATSFTGTWTRVVDTKTYGGEAMRADGLGNSYRFTPALSGPQQLRVSAWWSDAQGHSDQVEYRIQSSAGLSVVVVSQQVNGGGWQDLGVYPFAGDGTDYIEVGDPAGGEVIADAVRLSSLSPLTIETTNLAGAGLDLGYYQVLRATGGAEPYVWGVFDGTWPPGLVLDPNTGVISGVPSQVGSFDFTVELQDGQIPPEVRSVPLSLTVSSSPPGIEIIVDQKDRDTGFVGVWSLSGVGGGYEGGSLFGNSDAVDRFWFSPGLPLPGQYRVYAWWTAHSNRSNQVDYDILHLGQTDTVTVNQQISGGQWNELGVFSFNEGPQARVEVSDRNGPFAIADAVRFERIASGGSSLVVQTADLPNGMVDVAYSESLQVVGGIAPYTWTIISGGLPQGLTLSSGGVIEGTPLVAESVGFTVQVEDGNQDTAIRALTLDIDAQAVVDIVVDNGDSGTSSTGSWNMSSVAGSYNGGSLFGAGSGIDTYRYAPDFPQSGQYRVFAWWTSHSNRSDRVAYELHHAQGNTTVEVNQQVNGGQWNELGVFSFESGTTGSVELSDRNGAYAVADAVRFEFVGTSGLAVGTSSLPNGVLGIPYDQSLVADGGVAPYTWSLVGGSLPQGLSLANDGTISGVPSGAETAGFTVQVQDGNLDTASRSLTLTINASLPDIVIDNGDSETSATGSWGVSGVAGSYNADSLYGAGAGVDSYRYTPTIVQTGQYRVYAWWTAHANRSEQVAYSIQHAGGATQVSANQQASGGQWNELGVFTFTAGGNGFIEVSDSNGPYAIADAIRLEYIPASN